MKSHPDAASRSAAEVVTQLPVPSRLGMLRFERLNEPSWSLLFLDPACERQLGVSAGELCALLDCPYASLMEPEARYQLHDDIQRQLASTQHYSVRYRLHTPNGALMQLCLLAELWWAWCFRRSRALLPIAVAHTACALLVEAGLVGSLLRSLEVSARFFL